MLNLKYLKARGHEERAIGRRTVLAEQLRAKRSIQGSSYLKARDLNSVLATDHESNMTITAETDPAVLFASENSTCVLTPEVTQGPYWVSGEYVRQNVTEDQEGVALTLDIQVIDTNTCEPIPDVYLEMWHCNSTGIYSGIVASGNGNDNDTSNINATFLRGIQPSDSEGVLTFDSIFPGHYTSRTTHIHVLAHINATVYPNNTIQGGTIAHVGQVFFDQDLIDEVETTYPYTTNTQEVTTNADDYILVEEADTVDPVVEYVFLGNDVSDGILAWISFALNASASYDVGAAAVLGEDGGHKTNFTYTP
ncbi:Extracellular dioxygenase [Pleurostoma richardsiae]|uniref:Extracellular dioxygenase n=1 Tax=Pleurostoma richardsiae TaxID=41990 RepID=A0AA38VFT5_9PEZI|nr:Extracellular dioxygenase [Pleurostoma richardsiae]